MDKKEQVVEILVSNDMCVSVADDKGGVADQILALFPEPSVDIEEIEKVIINNTDSLSATGSPCCYDVSVNRLARALSEKFVKNPATEEDIRLLLLENIGWFIQEWEDRPKFGKGSDRSDLLKKLAHALYLHLQFTEAQAKLNQKGL